MGNRHELLIVPLILNFIKLTCQDDTGYGANRNCSLDQDLCIDENRLHQRDGEKRNHEIKFYKARYLRKCSEFWAQRLGLLKTNTRRSSGTEATFRRKRETRFLHEAFVLVMLCSFDPMS